MVDKKRLFELFEYVQKTKTASYYKQRIDDNLKKFDYEFFEKTYNILKHKDEYSEQDWVELYKNNKEQKIIMLIILENAGDKIPTDICDEIVQKMKKEFEGKTYAEQLDMNIEQNILSECLKKNISEQSIQAILDVKGFNSLTSSLYPNVDEYRRSYTAKEKLNLVTQENTKKIVRYAIQECEKKLQEKLDYIAEKEKTAQLRGETLELKDRTISDNAMRAYRDILSPISYIEDVKYLNDLFEEYETSILSNLISNAIIDSVVLNQEEPEVQELFEKAVGCCDTSLISHCPDCISSIVSNIIYDTLIEFLDNDCSLIKWGLTEHPKTKMPVYPGVLKGLIEKLCVDEMIAEGPLTDLAHRLANAKIRSHDSFTVSVFSHISNPDLIPLIDKLLSHNKTAVYERNPYIPVEMLVKRAEEYCNKINNYRDKGKEREISDTWYEQIDAMAKKATLSNKCYDTILNSFDEYKFMVSIMSKVTTPPEVLDKAIEFCENEENKKNKYYWLDKISFVSKINKLRVTGEINDDVAIVFIDATNSSAFNLKEDEPTMKYDNAHTSYHLQGAKFFPARNGTEKTKETIDYFKTLIDNNYFNHKEKVFINRIFEIMDDSIKSNEEKQKEQESDKRKLSDLAYRLQYELSSKYKIYTLAPLIVDELNEYFEKYYEDCMEEIKSITKKETEELNK